MNGVDALAEVEALLDAPVSISPDSHLRAAAVLTRQTLEQTLAGYWVTTGDSGLPHAKMRHQLIVLTTMWRGAAHVAIDLESTWYQLTHACHAEFLRLGPTRDDILRAIDAIRSFHQHATSGQRGRTGLETVP